MEVFINDKTFNKIDFSKNPLAIGEYDSCTFINCNFTETHLATFNFIDCEFEACNLSMVSLKNTILNNVIFSNCKMLGVDFSICNPFSFTINCKDYSLNMSSFYTMNLKGSKFDSCVLHKVDFIETNLSKLNFKQCDLKNAIFERSILEETNFYTAINYTIDLEKNKVANAKFSKNGILGLLKKYPIEIS